MKVEILLAAKMATRQNTKGKVVVVIDVLRATSVIVMAISSGARRVIATDEVEKAKKIAERGERDEKGGNVLLCGERGSHKINGFDRGNSPWEYSERATTEGRDIILTTTNGTRALMNSRDAERILIGTTWNIRAVAKAIEKDGRDVVIVCAGSEGLPAIEDMSCAARIVLELRAMGVSVEIDDNKTEAAVTIGDDSEWRAIAANGEHSKELIKKGYRRDVEDCLLSEYETEEVPEVSEIGEDYVEIVREKRRDE